MREANIMFLPQLTFLLTIYGTWLASSRTSKRGSSTTRPSLSGKATRMVLGQAHWIVQTSWKFTHLGTTVQRNLMYAPLYHPPARPKQVSAHAFPLKCVKESSPVNIRRITMYHNVVLWMHDKLNTNVFSKGITSRIKSLRTWS